MNHPDIVLITGSREWSTTEHKKIMFDRLSRLPAAVTIRQGGARGADTLAHQMAWELGMQVETFEADWKRLGRSAGMKRNLRMLETEPIPALVLAFATDIKTSKGTRGCALAAHERKLPLEIHQPGQPVQRHFIHAGIRHLTA